MWNSCIRSICTHSKIVISITALIKVPLQAKNEVFCPIAIRCFFFRSFQLFFMKGKLIILNGNQNVTQTFMMFDESWTALHCICSSFEYDKRHRKYRHSEYQRRSYSPQNFEGHFQIPSSIVLAQHDKAESFFSFGVNCEVQRVAGNEMKQQTTVNWSGTWQTIEHFNSRG